MNPVSRFAAVATLMVCVPLAQASAATDTPTPGLMDRIWSALLAPSPAPARHAVHAAHDNGRAATRVQAASAHEMSGRTAPRPGDQLAMVKLKPVIRAASVSPDVSASLLRTVAYQQAAVCDSLLCPNYVIIGVGF